jgi:predicted  nucleic acid-binding Zn-ribbon protein
MAKRPSSLHSIINELVDRTNTDTQRIRSLEHREESLTSRLENLEKDIMGISSSLQKISKDLEEGLRQRDRSISEIQSTIKEIIRHIKKLAEADKIDELEALLEIYNPLKSSFLTREEAEELISERLSRKS